MEHQRPLSAEPIDNRRWLVERVVPSSSATTAPRSSGEYDPTNFLEEVVHLACITIIVKLL